MVTTRNYRVADLRPYIDWSYFLHAWQMPVRFASLGNLHQCRACREGWLASQPEGERDAAQEAMHLVDDALKMLDVLDSQAVVKGRVGLYDANSDCDDIVLTDDAGKSARIPCLRQQVVEEGKPCLCLADFIRPKEHGIVDKIGVFATTVVYDVDGACADDAYDRMLAQTLCDRLAEAAACVLHMEVRRSIWGYAEGEDLTLEQLLHEDSQGIRPAVGYPSLPDQSINFILSGLLDLQQLGVTLTENGAMRPHATVTGLMISHPKARYFAVGRIDDEQLRDYAARRGLDVERMSQFLAANLDRASV